MLTILGLLSSAFNLAKALLGLKANADMKQSGIDAQLAKSAQITAKESTDASTAQDHVSSLSDAAVSGELREYERKP